MYHVHIGRLYFALLRDRRNGDFSRCRIENIFVTKKKKKKTIFHKQTKNVAILQIKFVFFLKKYSNEIWKVIKGTGSIEYP